MTIRRVTVFGGSGFLGRYVIERLADRDIVVTVAVRDTEHAKFLMPLGNVGQIVPVCASVTHQVSVDAAVAGADAVINLVGILHQHGQQTFKAVHADGAARVAKAAAAAGARHMVHLSAIGADARAPSEYARSKAAGEAVVQDAFADAVLLRPSIMFGPEDRFFNLFAGLARLSPVLPLIGGGRARFQPVYVGDVADAVVAALAAKGGGTYQLGGPEILTFADLMRLMLGVIGRRRLLMPIPAALLVPKAFFLEFLPNPPLTRDQLKQIQTDNVVADDALSFADLAIEPTPMGVVLPTYLARYRRGGRLGRMNITQPQA
ncbi:MAG: complex I NDUFA9 subunit family protein [Alphaproteobacteria bacterium]